MDIDTGRGRDCGSIVSLKKAAFSDLQKKKNRIRVTAYARPILYDAAKELYLNRLEISGTGQQVLNYMTRGQEKYRASSDIIKQHM